MWSGTIVEQTQSKLGRRQRKQLCSAWLKEAPKVAGLNPQMPQFSGQEIGNPRSCSVEVTNVRVQDGSSKRPS